MATRSSILAWRIPWTGSLVGYSPWGHQESDMTEATEPMQEMQETWVRSLGREDPLEKEKEMAIHSSILAWEIP